MVNGLYFEFADWSHLDQADCGTLLEGNDLQRIRQVLAKHHKGDAFAQFVTRLLSLRLRSIRQIAAQATAAIDLFKHEPHPAMVALCCQHLIHAMASLGTNNAPSILIRKRLQGHLNKAHICCKIQSYLEEKNQSTLDEALGLYGKYDLSPWQWETKPPQHKLKPGHTLSKHQTTCKELAMQFRQSLFNGSWNVAQEIGLSLSPQLSELDTKDQLATSFGLTLLWIKEKRDAGNMPPLSDLQTMLKLGTDICEYAAVDAKEFCQPLYAIYSLITHQWAVKRNALAQTIAPLSEQILSPWEFVAVTPIRMALAAERFDVARRLIDLRTQAYPEGPLTKQLHGQLLIAEGEKERALNILIESQTEAEGLQCLPLLEFERSLAAVPLHTHLSSPSAPSGIHLSNNRNQPTLVGNSDLIKYARHNLTKYAQTNLPILLTGESGTGKEVAAHLIHEASPRRGKPFVAINCAAFADGLLESELFGHCRGAFTGASTERKGLIEEAGEGTLFLDEIGSASTYFQSSLLRLLENGEFRHVGDNQIRFAGCRFVCATHELNPDQETIRHDLIQRLSALHVHLPPLRDRPEDIMPIAEFLLNNRWPLANGSQRKIEPALQRKLTAMKWEGNVRELRNYLDRLLALNPEMTIVSSDDIEESVHAYSSSAPTTAADRRTQICQWIEQQEKVHRAQIIRKFSISQVTATKDLQALCESGKIRKVCPTDAPRTHYWTTS